jgi:hypothetical protein
MSNGQWNGSEILSRFFGIIFLIMPGGANSTFVKGEEVISGFCFDGIQI